MIDQGSSEVNNPVVVLMPVFVAKPDRVAELHRALLVLQTASRADEGCLDYTVFADLDDQTRFVLYEEWTSSAALATHNEQSHVLDFVASADELLAHPFQVARLRSIV